MGQSLTGSQLKCMVEYAYPEVDKPCLKHHLYLLSSRKEIAEETLHTWVHVSMTASLCRTLVCALHVHW